MLPSIGTRKKKLWESPTEYIGQLPTTGKGVGVVVLDQGFDTTHPDFKDRISATVATSPQDSFESDPLGHGTHVLGIVGGNGSSSDGKIRGVAPEANLIPIKVNLDQKAGWEASAQSVASAVDWAVKHKDEFNIKVINCSFVLPMMENVDPQSGAVVSTFDPLGYAMNMAKEAGILVVGGAGNFADKARITTPSGNPHVIAVGALDTRGTPEDRSDDRVAGFSSRGLSYEGKPKPDILAPGVRIMSTNAPGSHTEERNAGFRRLATVALSGPVEEVQHLARQQVESGLLDPMVMAQPEKTLRRELLRTFDIKAQMGEHRGHPAYIAQNGTSEAAPIVSGVIAHIYEANPDLTPEQVREILFSTADPVAGEAIAVGHGAIDAQEAVQKALSLRAKPE